MMEKWMIWKLTPFGGLLFPFPLRFLLSLSFLGCRILLYDLNEAVEAFSRDVEARRPASFWRGLLGKSEQLVGNNEQITDLCFLGPKHLVIATNSQYVVCPSYSLSLSPFAILS